VKTKIGRQTLSKRVESAAKSQEIATERLRRWVAASALFQVLNQAVIRDVILGYAVKGGFAMELRFRGGARASKDIDLILLIDGGDPVESLRQALDLQWCEFSFEIKSVEARAHVHRAELRALYNGGNWCSLSVDLGSANTIRAESIEPFDLAFSGLDGPDKVACMSREQQLAEFIHAITDPDELTRYRNLVDVVLIDTHLGFDMAELRKEVALIFKDRAKHDWPPNFELPVEWEAPLQGILTELGMEDSPSQIAGKFSALIARILGVVVKVKYQYHFMVLSAPAHVPNLIESAIMHDESYNTFKRMTEEDGWRLAQVLQFPQKEATRAILVILEKELS